MKKLCVLLVTAVLSLTLFTGCSGTKEDSLTPLTLNEVVHSVFYAPQYVAIELGFFEEEGIDLTVDVGNGADKSMTALVSGNADVALCGTEAALYIHAEGRDDLPIVFAQLTQRAGNFLVAREPSSTFTWDDVRGKTIIGGRPGGMPEMVLEYILDQNGLTPGEDVEILTNLDLSATAGAFSSGTGDYTTEFEPGASTLENAGQGYVVTSLGIDSGYVPYTVYVATSSKLKNDPDLIQRFTNAIYKGQLWCQEHTSAEIAEVIHPQFSETDVETLTGIIERYRSQDTWTATPLMSEDSLTLIQDILEFSGTLSHRIDYSNAVTTTFAEKAAAR